MRPPPVLILLLAACAADRAGGAAGLGPAGGAGPAPGGGEGGGGSAGAVPSPGEGEGEGDGADPSPGGGGGEGEGEGGSGGEGEGDGGPPGPDCAPPARACLVPGGPTRLVCLPDGTWQIDQCAEGEVCAGEGRCIPDPARCGAGARTCLDGDVPAECEPGRGWRPLAACPEGQACTRDGQCRSLSCAAADRSRSYLGCDYLALDLPNVAFSAFGGTPDAPLGVVLTNPDRAHPVRVTVRTAEDGSLAALVDSVEIAPPPIVVFGSYRPQTVQSEVVDADGARTAERFDAADGLEVPPGGLATLLLPTHGDAGMAVPQRTEVHARAWTVTTDRPVAAYQFSPYCCNFSFSNDASLLIPAGAVGQEYLHVGVPSWNVPDEAGQMDGGYPATLTVAAWAPGTEVTVALPPGVGVAAPAQGGRVSLRGGVLTATLGRHEVLSVLSDPPTLRRGRALGVDLSGARVTTSQPASVFSGHTCAYYPQDQEACDHLEEQLFPTDTWGERFVLAPLVLRTERPGQATEATFWKILARDDGTTAALSAPFDALDPRPPGFDGVPDCADRLADAATIALDAGEFCEFGTRSPVALAASAPVTVLGIMSGQASTAIVSLWDAHAGDPAIFLLPPTRQHRQDYAFLTPGTFHADWATVAIPQGARLTLDGAPVDMAAALPVPGDDSVIIHVPVTDGPHQIQGTRPFSILVYAYDDYVSYAVPGGLNLDKR